MPQDEFGEYERALHYAARLQGLALIQTGDTFALVDYKVTGATLDEIAAYLAADKSADSESRSPNNSRRTDLRAMLKAERTLLAELEDQKRKSGNNSNQESADATLAEIRRRITEMQEANRN